MSDLLQELQRLGGTNAQASPVQAANAWAGTTGREFKDAINAACGTTGLEVQHALNVKAGTTQLDAVAAAALISASSGPSVRGSAAVVGTTMAVTVTQGDFDVAPQSGDLLVMFLYREWALNKKKGISEGADPTGWTQVAEGTNGDRYLTLYTKTAGGSEGDYAAAGGWFAPGVMAVVALSGATSIDDSATDSTFTGDATQVIPSVTALGTSVLVYAAHQSIDSLTSTPPGSETELIDGVTAALAGSTSVYALDVGAGATGVKTLTWSNTATNSIAVSCVIS